MGRTATHVVFGTSSWGLGHATRDLVLMRALLEAGCRLTIISTGPAMQVLRSELGDQSCRFLDWPDMPSTVARSTIGFYLKTVAHIPRIIATWLAERPRLHKLLEEDPADLVISDHRYGLVTPSVPSYFISHSPRYIAPWRDWFMEMVMERFMAHWLRHARAVLIPDDPADGLSGDMSHRVRYWPADRLVYLGILSSLRAVNHQPQDIDVFISISGPEPQRTQLERIVLPQLPRLEGRKVVVALGTPGRPAPPSPTGAQVHAYLDRAAQEQVMNRSRLVVCRSGYTTLMELAELGKKALLIPTPGQTEQLYLARTLRQRGHFYSVSQRKLSLARDVAIAQQYPGYRAAHPTAESVQRFLNVVLGCRPS
ncbi:MAG TPA: glycosyltransferase [Phycisphaeraceae bacterium]